MGLGNAKGRRPATMIRCGSTKNISLKWKGGLLMENSIQQMWQIFMNAFKKTIDYLEAHEFREIYTIADDLGAIGDEQMKSVIVEAVRGMDRALCEDAKEQRKADGFTIKERDVPRTVYTSLGHLTFERTYFNTPDGGHAYILDHILGISAYERVDAGVSAKMVNQAATTSYGNSAAIVTGGKISRQTAWKRTQEVGEVAYVPSRKTYTPEVLHIFADEDHVNMQDGTNTIVPLVTYCAGKRAVCKGRNELIDPVHIQGYGLKPEKHWEYVYAIISEEYDMTKARQVFIYGDGAGWIKAGFDVFPNAIHVLDEYHLEKRIKTLLSGEICGTFAPMVRAAVTRGDNVAFQKILCEMIDAVASEMEHGKGREKKLKSVRENGNFLLDHWQAILNNRLPGVIGSCTEAQVSHVLSKRLSRDPMGWSKEGLANLTMVRVYRFNGGNIEPCDIGKGKAKSKERKVVFNISKYEDIINKQHDEVFRGKEAWRWFARDDDNLISGKITGTKVALDALRKMRDIC